MIPTISLWPPSHSSRSVGLAQRRRVTTGLVHHRGLKGYAVSSVLVRQRQDRGTSAGVFRGIPGQHAIRRRLAPHGLAPPVVCQIRDTAQDLSAWRLVSETGDQSCSLGGSLDPGAELPIGTMTAAGGYSCGNGSEIWNDSASDPAVLYNNQGQEVTRQ